MNTSKKAARPLFSSQNGTIFVWLSIFAGLRFVYVIVWGALQSDIQIPAWALFDAAVVLALMVGLVFKRYWCAWLLLVNHLLSQAVVYATTGRSPGAWSKDLLFFYVIGAVGGFMARNQRPVPDPPLALNLTRDSRSEDT